MDVTLLKTWIALGGTGAVLLALQFRLWLAALPETQANRLLNATFLVTRLLPFLLIYVVFGIGAQSDVPVFFEAAREALRGKVVYRDFWSPYSPLFAYVTALPVALWFSPKAITLLMIIIEGVAWWLTYRFAQRSDAARARLSALVYLLLPAPFMFCVVGGQEDVWMWAFAVGALFFWQRSVNTFQLGLWLAVALLTTKALLVLFVVALLAWVRQPVRYVAGLLTIGIPSIIILYALTGEGILTPLMFVNMPFAPNLWTILAPFIGDFMPYSGTISTFGLLTTLGLTGWAAWRLRNETFGRALPLLWVICYGTLMVAHKSSFSNYAFIYMLPLVFTLVNWQNPRHVAALLVLNAFAAVHPTYWWRTLGAPIYTDFTTLLTPGHLLDYGMQLGVVGSVAYFVWLAVQQVRHLKTATLPDPSPSITH